MPKIPIESLLKMPKLLYDRINNSTIGELLNLVRQLNELIELEKPDTCQHTIECIVPINAGYQYDEKVPELVNLIWSQIGYLMWKKSPKVDHREWSRMKQLMNDIGFQVFKINKDGEEEGLELSVGDYEQSLPDGKNGKIVVERKSDDFLSSIFSGHLDEQLSNIVNDENIITGFLILDKSLDDLLMMAKERDISENVVYGAIASCCLKGFVPLFAGSMENFRDIVNKIFEKAYDGKDRIYRPKLEVGKGENIITFPGIDKVIGKRLYEHFGSIKKVINASKEELMQVKGIGEKLANKIIELVN